MPAHRVLTPLRTFLLGALLIASALALLLNTREWGFGRQPGFVPDPSLSATENAAHAARFPMLLEDQYDRLAYQKRGRWLASGATPYLEEFSEYPQLTTWLMGVPYLFFDHRVQAGTPYDTRARVWAWFEALRVPRGWFNQLDEALERNPLQPERLSDLPALAPLMEQLAGRPDIDQAAARAQILDLWSAWQGYRDELARNRDAYADWHQVLMAAWYLVLLGSVIGILSHLGRAPAYALLLLLPSTLFYGFSRFDLVVSSQLALTLLLWLKGRFVLGGLLLGVAAMTKWWPGFLGPLLALWAVRSAVAAQRSAGQPVAWGRILRQRLLTPAAVALGFCVLVLATTYLWDDGGWPAVRFVLDWHRTTRLPNHASALTLLTEPGHLEWFSSADRAWLGSLFSALQLGLPLLLALLPIRDRDTLIKACLVSALGMLLYQKFFSPQWVMWATTLAIPLAARSRTYLLATVVLDLLIYIQLPVAYYHTLLHGGGDPSQPSAFWTISYVRLWAFGAYWLFVLVDTLQSALRRPPSSPRVD
jgi:hypothetical protein